MHWRNGLPGRRQTGEEHKSVDLKDSDAFIMMIGNVNYADKKEAGEALPCSLCRIKDRVSTGGKVGEYHGFSFVSDCLMRSPIRLSWRSKENVPCKLRDWKDPAGNIQRIHNTFFRLREKRRRVEQKLETVQQQLATAQEEVKKPFLKEAELNERWNGYRS